MLYVDFITVKKKKRVPFPTAIPGQAYLLFDVIGGGENSSLDILRTEWQFWGVLMLRVLILSTWYKN